MTPIEQAFAIINHEIKTRDEKLQRKQEIIGDLYTRCDRLSDEASNWNWGHFFYYGTVMLAISLVLSMVVRVACDFLHLAVRL